MISNIIAILAGLALLAHWLKGGAAKFAQSVAQFDVVIGVIALVIGVLELLSLEGILLILAGLVLAANALRSISSVGESLTRVVLLVGILNLLSALWHFLIENRPDSSQSELSGLDSILFTACNFSD